MPSGEIPYMVCNFDPSIHRKSGKGAWSLARSRYLGKSGRPPNWIFMLGIFPQTAYGKSSSRREVGPENECPVMKWSYPLVEGPCICSKFYWKISSSGSVACEPGTCGWNVGTGQDAKAKGRPKRFGCSCYIIFETFTRLCLVEAVAKPVTFFMLFFD